MMKYLLLVVLAALGCADNPIGEPGLSPTEAQAVDVVWHQVYGMPGDAPPIYYVTGSRLDCADGQAFNFKDYGCLWGFASETADWVVVAWPEGATWGKSGLSHELRHIKARWTVGNQYGGWDHASEVAEVANHDNNAGSIWGLAPAEQGDVGNAMRALIDAGL